MDTRLSYKGPASPQNKLQNVPVDNICFSPINLRYFILYMKKFVLEDDNQEARGHIHPTLPPVPPFPLPGP